MIAVEGEAAFGAVQPFDAGVFVADAETVLLHLVLCADVVDVAEVDGELRLRADHGRRDAMGDVGA